MSSRAWTLDLIRAIGQKTALADHNKEKIEDNQITKTEKDKIRELDKQVLKLRREQESYLLENAQTPNPTFWCHVKHSIDSYTHDVEVYEAQPNKTTENFMIQSGNILAGYLSLFLGMEFETCARCLYDKMLVEQFNKERNENGDNQNIAKTDS